MVLEVVSPSRIAPGSIVIVPAELPLLRSSMSAVFEFWTIPEFIDTLVRNFTLVLKVAVFPVPGSKIKFSKIADSDQFDPITAPLPVSFIVPVLPMASVPTDVAQFKRPLIVSIFPGLTVMAFNRLVTVRFAQASSELTVTMFPFVNTLSPATGFVVMLPPDAASYHIPEFQSIDAWAYLFAPHPFAGASSIAKKIKLPIMVFMIAACVFMSKKLSD
jgi:hypothetical protein